MEYEDWEKTIPKAISMDALWKIKAYRLALYLSDLGWQEVTCLAEDPHTARLSDQLYRSLGSISANLAEGYSRSSGKARALYYEYALGSARESRDWYYKSRYILSQEIINQRIQLLTEVIKLLLTMVPDQRTHSIREGSAQYDLLSSPDDPSEETINGE